LFVLTFLAFSILFAGSALRAQVPDPAAASQSPIPGAGHHYLGLGSEIVTPVDGLVSFSLPVSTPAGRQLSIPFGFRYASSEQFYLAEYSSSALLVWLPHLSTPGEIGGWSYDLPGLSFAARVQSFTTSYTGQPPNGAVNHQCDSSLNYIFRGLDAAQYTLNLGFGWVDQNSTNTNPPTLCPSQFSSSSGPHGIAATTPNNWSGWPTHPPVTVVDQSGTTYQFGALAGINPSLSSSESWVWLSLPQTITDRNGNQLTSTFQGFKDTLGRNALSWTGFGNDGDQVSISGLSSNITLHWTTKSVTFPGTIHNVAVSDPNEGTHVNCTLGNSPAGSVKVVSEIDLPNGQKYTFSYDPNGRVNKIIFPGGGYARYVWGLNTSSTAAFFANFSQPQGNNDYCNVQYDVPAVADRYVSYDGSTEVLHQHFVYSTNWNSSSPWIWATKSTTVTTTDLLTNQVAVAYNYIPVAADIGGPYSATGSNVQSTVPVESSVLYKDGSGHTLKTVNKTWLNAFSMTGEQSILDNGQGTTNHLCYETNEPPTDIYKSGF
jgi:YD repeat-containing protein